MVNKSSMSKVTRSVRLMIFGLLIVFSLSGCSKKKVDSKPAGFGENVETVATTAQETETEVDKFAVTDQDVPGYEIKETKTAKKNLTGAEVKESLQEVESSAAVMIEEAQKEKAEALGQEYNPTEYVEETVTDSSSDEVYYIEDLGDGLVGDMREQIYSGLITEEGMSELDEFIDENFDVSEELKAKIHDYITECWEDYSYIQESLANLPPEETWSDDELEQNPDLRNYSRSEVEYMQEQLKKNGIEISN